MGLRDAFGGAKGNSNEKAPDGPPEDTEVLDDEPKNILLHMIAQLRPGMDLHRVTFPTFVLEPRSMLERIGDSLGHADVVFHAGSLEDPSDRFIAVLRYYMSGWHIKVPGVKKPYNPVLGEFFRCRYDYANGTCAYYISEQVSHHPPVSAFYYCSPENNVEVYGELRPKSKFLGNSAATIMGGTSKLRFLDRPDDGEYVITMPNMYARGILFGKMVFELGDQSEVRNENNDISADVEFKTKGFFTGTYNGITGKVKWSNGETGDLSGSWSGLMELKRSKKGGKETLFDVHSAEIPTPKVVSPEDKQEERESRRLWSKVTEALKKKDQNTATDEKLIIEEAQRDERASRGDEAWSPRFFDLRGEDYHPKFQLPEGVDDKAELTSAVRNWVYFNDSYEPPLPERKSS